VEEICEQWENETIVAMNNRLRTTDEDLQRKLLSNYIDAYRSNRRPNDSASLQCKFLRNLIEPLPAPVIIIHSEESGEQLMFRNRLLYCKGDVVHYNEFIYSRGEWTEVKGGTLRNFPFEILDDDLGVKTAEGINDHDITIMEIDDSLKIKTNYYLASTLGGPSSLGKVIASSKLRSRKDE
jgi:hypothetical protein